MNINKLLKQAQKMQEQVSRVQAELAEKTVEATAGGGKVVVVANGGGDIVSIKISPEVIDPADPEMLEDLVLSGVKQAQEKAREMAGAAMGNVTGGLGLPGM